jgi:hypothetical protein
MPYLTAEIPAEVVENLYRFAGLVTAIIAAVAWVFILINQWRIYAEKKSNPAPPLTQKEFNRQVRAYRRRLCRQFRHADRKLDCVATEIKEVRDAIKRQGQAGQQPGGGCNV